MTILGKLTVAVVLIAAVIGIAFAADRALSRMERRECYEWQHEAIYNPNALTGYAQWQVEQCKAHGVNVDWPVQK